MGFLCWSRVQTRSFKNPALTKNLCLARMFELLLRYSAFANGVANTFSVMLLMCFNHFTVICATASCWGAELSTYACFVSCIFRCCFGVLVSKRSAKRDFARLLSITFIAINCFPTARKRGTVPKFNLARQPAKSDKTT